MANEPRFTICPRCCNYYEVGMAHECWGEAPGSDDGDLSYGHCPKCGAPGKVRDRSPDGNTVCENGHSVKSTVWDRLQDEAERVIREMHAEGKTLLRDRPAKYDSYGRCEPSELRIEALRAASRIVAHRDMGVLHKRQGVDDTIYLAEHFVKWLEGDR